MIIRTYLSSDKLLNYFMRIYYLILIIYLNLQEIRFYFIIPSVAPRWLNAPALTDLIYIYSSCDKLLPLHTHY